MSSLHSEIEILHKQNLYRRLRAVDSDQGAVLTIEGQQVINFSSNNYLGLANHPALKEAAIRAIQEFGTGSGASRLITGSMRLHHELEEKIAQFKSCEAALLFNSGYHANLGVLTALLQKGDMVFSDELNHASIVDGCRLSGATIQVYRHRDVNHLEELLRLAPLPNPLPRGERGKKTSPLPRWEGIKGRVRRLIVTDSVFSMDGDLAPLKDLALLAEKYETWLMVDEAHATGVWGPKGRGLVEEVWPEARPAYLQEHLIQMGTLGKALGSFGAYIAGSQTLIDFLINKARSFIYTTALPPPVVAASLAALDLVEREPERRKKLWENVECFKSKLGEGKSPIIPFVIGGSEKVLELSERLFKKGLWVSAIRYPTVPQGTERLRITLMSTHTKEQLDCLVEALKSIGL